MEATAAIRRLARTRYHQHEDNGREESRVFSCKGFSYFLSEEKTKFVENAVFVCSLLRITLEKKVVGTPQRWKLRAQQKEKRRPWQRAVDAGEARQLLKYHIFSHLRISYDAFLTEHPSTAAKFCSPTQPSSRRIPDPQTLDFVFSSFKCGPLALALFPISYQLPHQNPGQLASRRRSTFNKRFLPLSAIFSFTAGACPGNVICVVSTTPI